MIFSRKEMKLVLKGKLGKVLKNEITEVGDWFTTHSLVFKINNHVYQVFYEESIYEKPFSWEDNIEVTEITKRMLA